ncbi:MAG: hypothetical protein A2X86_09685 [Bdellovibrionales bacterium GWA2_49_15]|nr:MAG: hypothetical protein A2X86_09685 [Bdellovibrionales bacterium GWA2_49_15]HAZ13051.1 hypothetical protein [Bdellovibrionales bacterium]
MQQQFEFIKTLTLCLAFVSLVLAQVFVPLLKVQAGPNKFKNILSATLIRNILIALFCFISIFILAKKNALPAPGWAIPFSVFFLDFLSYFWHFLSHRWRTGNYFHSRDALAHMTDVWQSMAPRLFMVWGLRLPVEGLLLYEFILVFGFLLEVGLAKSPPWVERFLAGILMTPMLVTHHYTMIKGKPSRKNFGIVFSFWDRAFGTYVAPNSSEPEAVVVNLRT